MSPSTPFPEPVRHVTTSMEVMGRPLQNVAIPETIHSKRLGIKRDEL